jgi:hypothetical protein
MKAPKRLLTNKQRKALGLNIPNPDRVRADQETRRSNAGRPHSSLPRRQRSRRDSVRGAIKDGE